MSIKGRLTSRGERAVCHRDGSLSGRRSCGGSLIATTTATLGPDAPADHSGDVPPRDQSVMQAVCHATAVRLSVCEASGGSAATEVDSGTSDQRTTKVDSPPDLHVSIATEVDCDVDSSGVVRRGDLGAAGTSHYVEPARWETLPPPDGDLHRISVHGTLEGEAEPGQGSTAQSCCRTPSLAYSASSSASAAGLSSMVRCDRMLLGSTCNGGAL